MPEEKNNQAKIIIYSTEWCGFCKLVKAYLDEKNMSYEEVDVSQDEQALKTMVEKTGQQGVPVITIEKDGKEEIIIGFQKEKINQILNIS